MLLRCCLIHITIIILKHILHLVCLRQCLDLGLFISHLCDLFFIFSLISISINHTNSLKQTHLFFVHYLEYFLLFLDGNVDGESELFLNSKSLASRCCLDFAWFFCQFQPGVAYKSVAYKKSV